MPDLEVYRSCVEKIRRNARENGISDIETSKIFQKVFCDLEKKHRTKKRTIFFYVKACVALVFLLIACFLKLDHRPFATTIVRNLQTSIYPGLTILRKIAVPILSYYPQLSEYYDEWCLLENPYFYVSDMDCWPCSMVRSVPDLTGRNISRSFNLGIPYTRLEKKTDVQMSTLHDLYWNHSDVFEKHAAKVFSNNGTYRFIKDVMSVRIDLNPSEYQSNRIKWRVNRMEPGRVLRKLFKKPAHTPEWWEPSVERYILIDEARSAAYSLPNPECSNVVIRCTEGARLIKMVPSAECTQSCQTSTILLSAGNTLWYNWWYWRPVSLPPSNSTGISILFLTSFC